MQKFVAYLVLTLLFMPAIIHSQQPGTPKTLRPSDAVSDASGTGQLFQNIHVPGITNNVQGTNGFAVADLDGNGYLDIVQVTTPPFNLEGWPPRDSICDSTINFSIQPDSLARDKLRILLNKGDWVFEQQKVTLTGSSATAQDLSQGWRGAQIPVLADFNNDSLFDLFIGRQPAMMSQGQIPPGTSPVGCSFLLAQDSLNHFRDISQQMNALNPLAYNRQLSVADVNEDGWLDIAIGADNVAAAFEGLPRSALYTYQPSGSQFTDGMYQEIGSTYVHDYGGFYLDPAKDKAGPDINLRDVDQDGDIDLFQGCHTLPAQGQPSHPYWPGEYRQGIFTWQNRLTESSTFSYEKDSMNGIAQEARMAYDTATKKLVRMNPQDSAIGLSYLYFGDVDNDGILDVLALDGSDRDRLPHPIDVGARFWYGKGNFSWMEATAAAGLDSLNENYLSWYNFFDEQVTQSLYFKPDPVPGQPGLDPQRFAYRTPYHGDAAFADFNNDGWLDLVVLDRRQKKKVVSSRTKLFMNNGDGTFSVKTTEFSGIDASGISCEADDLNNDGLVDLIIAEDPDNSGAPCYAQAFEDKVYMNTGNKGAADNHWLRFRFDGITHARLIGARVVLRDPQNGDLLGMRGIYTNQTYKSSSAMEAHFGLGNQTCADVQITLQDGTVFTQQCVQADQYLTVDFEDDSLKPVGFAKQRHERSPDVRIFPNPSQRRFHIAFDEDYNSSYKVINRKGEIISAGNVNSASLSIDLAGFPVGMYFIQFSFEGKNVRMTRKIVKL